MSLSLEQIELAAKQIVQKLESGELVKGCSMSALQTPITEAWELAQELVEKNALSSRG